MLPRAPSSPLFPYTTLFRSAMEQQLKRELLAEGLGTFVLMVFGLAVVAQVVLSGQTAGEYLSINIGWGLGVTFGCYVSAGVSGRSEEHTPELQSRENLVCRL